MYFKKLELVGFKSFANKTTLHFEPGITAVVGPNGCGKSNIFDSIRWVLGEQSVKSLRGTNMEDVIFNGTDSKEPLGMAEVSLSFDNTNKAFPIDHNEVLITRRIFRSGESEYLLNKTQVRLKDILDLLAGTGIGAESYSLIPQGKIDMILSSKPEDRRLVFDEASGITKYKSQKREALRRLEETDQNLLRVNDIIIEVKRQIGSLERQANKARRYKEVFEELKTKETKLAVKQKKEIELEKLELSNKLSELQINESSLINIISQQEAGTINISNEVKNLENLIQGIKDELMNLNNLISFSSERINFNKERIIELETNKNIWISQLEQAKARLIADEEKLNSLKTEYTTIKSSIEEKTAQLIERENQLNNISTSIRTSLEKISEGKKSIMDFASRISLAKNELSELNSKQQIYFARKKRLEIEKLKISEEKSLTENNLNNIRLEVSGLEAAFGDLNNHINTVRTNLDNENNSLNSINLEIENLEKHKVSLESQKQFLEQLRTKYEDISESMGAVIYLDKPVQDKISGLVIKVNGLLDLSEEEKSKATLKVSGEAKAFDLNTENISEKINQTEQKIVSLKESKSQKLSIIDEINKNLTKLQADLRNQEINLANKRTTSISIEDQFNKIKDEDELIMLELNEVEAEMVSMNVKLSGLEHSLEDLSKEQNTNEDSIAIEQNNIAINYSKKEEVLVAITQTKTELDALSKRISSDDDTLKILEIRYHEDRNTLINLEKQIQDSDAKHLSLETEIKELENKIGQTNLDIATCTLKRKETEAQHTEISKSLNEMLLSIETNKKSLDSLKESVFKNQGEYKDIDFKYLSIKERLIQAYKIDLDSLVEEATASEESKPQETNIFEEIQKLKEKLDSYGSVNLVAIEEYDELKKRYDFLTQQQTDLVTAKESLHEAILKINRTTKKMFMETFELIKVEFRNYFKLLFNGGDAQVYLIDENDPLESGIEIICKPPGKKLQNVLLLSGGEKSMSAVALIFAIFKIKPAPFCVLDEIDAALDEANVDRFGRTLQEFSKISQFIVITHNKKTIANADIMYGITMEESGVSKIVSVKFSQNKAKKAIDPDGQTTEQVPETV